MGGVPCFLFGWLLDWHIFTRTRVIAMYRVNLESIFYVKHVS